MLRESEGADELADLLRIYCPEILHDGVLAANPRDRPVDVFSGDDKREVIRKECKGKGGIVLVGGDNSDLAPILQYRTVLGVVAGLDAKSARSRRRVSPAMRMCWGTLGG